MGLVTLLFSSPKCCLFLIRIMTRCRYGKGNRDVDEWWNAINAERYAVCGVPQTSHFDGHCCDIHDVTRDLSRKRRFAAGNITTGVVRSRIFSVSVDSSTFVSEVTVV